MKNIMGALGLKYYRSPPYKLPDADLVIESSYGQDTAWIVGKGIRIINDIFQAETLAIIANLLSPNINISGCFTADITSGNAPLTVSFTDLTPGSPTVWLWDFGDGFQSNEQNPVHVYTTVGSYTVILRSFTSSTVTTTGSLESFENRTSGSGHGSNAAAHTAFIAAPWTPVTGIQVARYHVQEAGGTDFQYNATRADIEGVDLSAFSAPDIALLEILYQNVNSTEGAPELIGTGELLNPGDSEWKFAADISSSLGGIFVDSIGESVLALLTSPASGQTHGWQASDARAVVHTPISAVSGCTGIDFITVV
jgi:hypothetical protein